MGKIKQTIEETIKYMWRNQKNRLFMGLLLALMLVYVIVFAPNFNSHHDLDMQNLEFEMVGSQTQAEDAKDKGLIVPSIMTQTTAYIQRQTEFGQNREMYTTLQHGDINRYLEIQELSIPEEPETDLSTLFFSLFGEDPLHAKSWQYRSVVPNLNFHIIHEITSLQQIHLFLIGSGPLILLSGLIFMISDVHTKDLSLSTQKSGVPLNWSRYLLIQSLTALGFVLAFYAVFFGLFYSINGILHGFGGLYFPISFPQETIGWFLIRTIPYILILFLLFTRLNTLLSLWTGNSVVTMAVLIFIVFFSSIYMDNFSNEFIPIDLAYLPTSYIPFGIIITNRHTLGPAINGLTVYTSGLIILGITLLVTELVLYVTTKRMTRQKYIAWGAN